MKTLINIVKIVATSLILTVIFFASGCEEIFKYYSILFLGGLVILLIWDEKSRSWTKKIGTKIAKITSLKTRI